MRRITAVDMLLLLCVLTLVTLGIMFIYSASYPKALAGTETGGNAFFFAGKQIMNVISGLIAMVICAFIPLSLFYRHPRRQLFYRGVIWIVLAMLIAVLFTREVHGNKAWLGPIQPSEFAKVGLVIVLSAFLARRPWTLKSWKGFYGGGPAAFFAAPVLLIAMEKDLGSMLVFALSTAVFLLIAGARFRFIGVPLALLLVLGAAVVLSGHRSGRVDAWLNPEAHSTKESFQTLNSLIAVSSGGLFGRGFCQGRQKWFYLPASQSDSIFAVIAEELGFLLTVLAIFVPYLLLVFRGFSIAHRAPDEFGALVATGATVMLATPALINLAVVLNLMPLLGINLPYISYGGSSMVSSLMMAGLLLNVSSLRSAPDVRAARPVAPAPAGA